MTHFRLRRVVVEDDSRSDPLTHEVLKRLEAAFELRPDKRPEAGEGASGADELQKDVLHLMRHKGAFFKPCPGTNNYICCGYRILHVGTHCPLDCSYCILQGYFNQPHLRVFSNLHESLGAVLRQIDAEPQTVFRIGTGEFTDSLALDPLVHWTAALLPPFSARPNAVLELKTKTDHIQGLLNASVRDRIIVSWSLNAPYICAREERGAAPLKRRLEAAAACQAAGFTLGFHFDPLLEHPGWQDGYARTVELLDRYINPEGIIWISLGGMRYMPHLKSIIRRRHPNTCVLDGEFVPGSDGKMRLFKPIRIGLFRHLQELLGSWHPDLGLYLCMESEEVWQASLGWSPNDSVGLAAFLDHRVKQFFGWPRG